MNQGVALLLKRMETNPEEFPLGMVLATYDSRWGKFLQYVVDNDRRGAFLSDKERQLLTDKYWSLQATAFSEAVMQELVDPDPELPF